MSLATIEATRPQRYDNHFEHAKYFSHFFIKIFKKNILSSFFNHIYPNIFMYILNSGEPNMHHDSFVVLQSYEKCLWSENKFLTL